MSEEQPSRNPGGEMWTHGPLPYVVRVRVVQDEDAAPEVRELRLVAYSIFEAMLQATVEAGGSSLDDAKVKVEYIAPDGPAYLLALLKNATAAVGRR